MKIDRPIQQGTKNQVSNRVNLDVLPPVQAGLSAALHRAFSAPVGDESRLFNELLKKIA